MAPTLHLPEKEYSLRHMTTDDVAAVNALLYPDYFNESRFHAHATYSEDRTLQMLHRFATEAVAVVAVDLENDVFGFIVLDIYHTMFEEPEVEIVMLYVAPEWRGSGAAQELRNAADYFCKQQGAMACYAPDASGVSEVNDRLWVNMFKKIGFESLGSNLVKWYK